MTYYYGAIMAKSIIQSRKECYVTGCEYGIDAHHCFKGSRRKKADKYGLIVYLRHDIHMAMHDHCKPYENLENELKQVAQKAFEKYYSRDLFMQEFGANYLA